MNEHWINRYFDLAKHISCWSRDPSTKVGAVIVGKDRRNIAFGYNGFPPGVKDLDDRLNDRSKKYLLTQHAERNALDLATFDTTDSLLVVTMYPCSSCAKSIVSKGIKTVVSPPPLARDPWMVDAEWSRLILSEGGVDWVEIPMGEPL